MHQAIMAIVQFWVCLKLDHAGQHAAACTSLDYLKVYLEWGHDYLLQAACWLSQLCLAMPARHGTTVQEFCWGKHLRVCMRCTQDCIGLGMILDEGMASKIMSHQVPAIDPDTRSRILYAYDHRCQYVGQLGHWLIKKARTTREEPEAACPGMGGAASSSMEIEPRYAWSSSAAGPAPAP